jgi:hypothetical protein
MVDIIIDNQPIDVVPGWSYIICYNRLSPNYVGMMSVFNWKVLYNSVFLNFLNFRCK